MLTDNRPFKNENVVKYFYFLVEQGQKKNHNKFLSKMSK